MRTKPMIRAARCAAAVLVLMVLLLPATAAFAKGDLQPTSIALFVTGPGIDRPIAASWQGSCFVLQQFACSKHTEYRRESQGFPGDLGTVSGPLWTLANDSNFLAQATGAAGAYRAPQGDLGPRYLMRWTVTVAGRAEVIDQELYPWGPPPLKGLPRVPWIYTPPGHAVLEFDVGSGWMPATPVFFQDLASRGLPATAPADPSYRPPPAPPAADPPGAAVRATVAAHPAGAWAVAVGAALLLVLLGLAVVLGRPGGRVQPAA